MNSANDKEFTQLASDAVAAEELAARRAGTDGVHCFFCGHSGIRLTSCECSLPENFGCAGKRVCASCETAMKDVARHLRNMFAAKRVGRVSSVRAKSYRELYRASRDGDDETARPGSLRFYLGQGDPFDDEPVAFERAILRAFKRSHFLNFQKLAAGLEEQKTGSFLLAIIRSGICR